MPPQALPEYHGACPGQRARAFIELKEPGKSLDPRRMRGHDTDQFRRFEQLPLWALCNFRTPNLYRRGEPDAPPLAFLPAAASTRRCSLPAPAATLSSYLCADFLAVFDEKTKMALRRQRLPGAGGLAAAPWPIAR